MLRSVSNRIAELWCSSLGLALLMLLVAPPARAQPGIDPGIDPGEPLGAGLWMAEGEGDEPWLAPQVSSEAHVHVTGMIARARVEQLFENPSEQAVEAVYVFPLPETAAVDGLTLQVGTRTLTGSLRERAAAARSFESAAQQGHVASLVSEERPDVFTTRVANIPPGARVVVTLTYHDLVAYEHGMLSLGVPSTLTPRRSPGAGSADPGAREALATSARLDPPLSLDGSGPLLSVSVDLDRGVELASIESPSHELDLGRRGDRVQVRLREEPVLADHDFRLRWRPAPAELARAVSVEDTRGARYLLATLRPPFDREPAASRALAAPAPVAATGSRDITFVIDASRSMAGAPLQQAVAALRAELSLLAPSDHFNVIEVGSTARALFEASRPASAPEVARALEHAAHVVAAGGDTALSPALSLALDAPSHPERSQRVVLISDGAIDDAGPLLRQIHAGLRSRRLFTLGVGPAPGRYVLSAAARAGRGTFTAIASLGETAARVAELDAALAEPVLEGVALVAPAEAGVRLGGELYAGEPLSVLARLATGAPLVTLRARHAGDAWQRDLDLGAPARQVGLARIWARRELDAIAEGLEPGATSARLLELARERGLASAATSFIAVDSERSVEERAPSSAVPLALPAGSEMFGKQRPTPAGPTCSPDRPAPVLRASVVAVRAHVQCGLSG